MTKCTTCGEKPAGSYGLCESCRVKGIRGDPLIETLRARVTELEKLNKNLRDMHARILSWAPEDVQRAYVIILQMAANMARRGEDGKRVRDAVDSIQKHVSQLQAELDAAHVDKDSGDEDGS